MLLFLNGQRVIGSTMMSESGLAVKMVARNEVEWRRMSFGCIGKICEGGARWIMDRCQRSVRSKNVELKEAFHTPSNRS